MTHDSGMADIREMVVVHRVLRREFGALPAAVRSVRAGDQERVQTLSRHLRLMLTGLHLHHESEDIELWPLLQQRAPAREELTTRMQAQHEELARLVDETSELAASWERSPDDPEPLAQALEALHAALLIHLGEEEVEMLPVVAEHISATEWAKLGEHARNNMRLKEAPLMFGALLEECDASERAMMLAGLPGPMRLLVGPVMEPIYRRYIRKVRAGSPA